MYLKVHKSAYLTVWFVELLRFGNGNIRNSKILFRTSLTLFSNSYSRRFSDYR
jgi:hypothetical protein